MFLSLERSLFVLREHYVTLKSTQLDLPRSTFHICILRNYPHTNSNGSLFGTASRPTSQDPTPTAESRGKNPRQDTTKAERVGIPPEAEAQNRPPPKVRLRSGLRPAVPGNPHQHPAFGTAPQQCVPPQWGWARSRGAHTTGCLPTQE